MPLGVAPATRSASRPATVPELPQRLVPYVRFHRIKKKNPVLMFIMLYFFDISHLSFSCNSFF